jgi:hypothetical protein
MVHRKGSPSGIVIIRTAKTINNQKIGVLKTAKINKNRKRSDKVETYQKPIEYVYNSMGNALIVRRCSNKSDISKQTSKIKLGGVGHCFAWHVRVSLGFYFKTEELVDSGLCAM